MNVKDFLQGKFSYQFTDATIIGVMLERSISIEADYDQVTKQLLDLARADLLMFLCRFTNQGSESVKKGSWNRTTAAKSISPEDKKAYKEEANGIYQYYGEPTDYSFKDQSDDW